MGTVHQAIIGTNYDVVGFDPRGIGYAHPSANCSDTSTDGLPQTALTRRGVVPDLVTQKLTAPLLDEGLLKQVLEEAQQLGQQCNVSIGGDDQIGRHMSTIAVATDLKLIVDAFAQTGDGRRAASNASRLNYWGFSYGTFLGMTFAGKFPDSVGNMVLDGNENPYDSFSRMEKAIYYTDDIISNFLWMCSMVGRDACAFATGSSSDDVYDRFETLIWNLDGQEAHELHWTNASTISAAYMRIQSAIKDAAYQPIEQFPALANTLVSTEAYFQLQHSLAPVVPADVFTDIVGRFSDEVFPQSEPAPKESPTEWFAGVSCSEADPFYGKPLSFLKKFYLEQRKQSVFFADSSMLTWVVWCFGWPVRADWRYTGPFEGKTSNPIQFVANTFDPITPIENAQNASAAWDDARLITIDALGVYFSFYLF